MIGIEREFFITEGISRKPIPRSPEFLQHVKNKRWTYELSACQVEDRTIPCEAFLVLEAELRRGSSLGRTAALTMGCHLEAIEVAPLDMPKDIYPDEPRYEKISSTLDAARLLSALRIAGTHIHYGVRNLEEALRISNVLNAHIEELSKLGDGSRGERIKLYQQVAQYPFAPQYESTDHYYHTAREQGFDANPKNCWHLIRINPQGTVEVRVFGTAFSRSKNDQDINRIVDWAKRICDLVNLLLSPPPFPLFYRGNFCINFFLRCSSHIFPKLLHITSC